MRVALCLSSQMRNFEECIPSMLKYFLDFDKYEVDVFVSTWRKRGAKPKHEGTKKNQGDLIDEAHIRSIIPNVKVVEIEDFAKTCSPKLFDQIGILFPMYYKFWKADQLRQDYEKEHGFKYDWVIRSRADLMFRKDAQFNFEGLDSKVLYHSRGSLYKWDGPKYKLHWQAARLTPQQYRDIYNKDERIDKSVLIPKGRPTGLHDQIALGKPELVKIYTDSWLYIDNWIKSNPRPRFPFHTRPRSAKHAHEAMIYQMWIHNIKTQPLNKLVYMTYRG